eukprot:219410-Heterocapsa_arctica.AAC.1
MNLRVSRDLDVPLDEPGHPRRRPRRLDVCRPEDLADAAAQLDEVRGVGARADVPAAPRCFDRLVECVRELLEE